MTVIPFGSYAAYYDLLYRDKDYAAEARFVDRELQRARPGARTILEFGCGTGAHAEQLVGLGYTVEGVDQSAGMLAAARARTEAMPADQASRLSVHEARIGDVHLGRTFDAVISLFHVFSYQTDNESLSRAIRAARAHLSPGGVLLFDCWYGPGVLTDRPAVRVKRLSDEAIDVTRIAEPVLHINDNVVDVHYQVFIRQKTNQHVDELTEEHRMRYFFVPELTFMLESHGFAFEGAFEWLTGTTPGAESWAVYVIARAL
jgi:SAM-dependent methyltransferase